MGSSRAMLDMHCLVSGIVTRAEAREAAGLTPRVRTHEEALRDPVFDRRLAASVARTQALDELPVACHEVGEGPEWMDVDILVGFPTPIARTIRVRTGPAALCHDDRRRCVTRPVRRRTGPKTRPERYAPSWWDGWPSWVSHEQQEAYLAAVLEIATLCGDDVVLLS